ncbi:MAG TPA: HesA/MoeB/ThiF family protein [Firmicutes bacterium]|nr:HesA/MoeB/ThiF family protein [Bacillota bacterium]
MAHLSQEEKRRYSRQIIIPGIGEEGQQKLKDASVLVIGAGGLGSPAALYLAAAGVGTIGIVDSDDVEISNLQRQVLHTTADIGRPKIVSAERTIKNLNPNVNIVTYGERLTADNASRIIRDYDLVVDAVDNFQARYIVNDTCVLLRKSLVEAGVMRFGGMVMTIVPFRGPCYRCIFPDPPAPGSYLAPGEAGIIGAVPGMIGSIEALEAIKLLIGTGEPLVGRLLLFDGLDMRFTEVSAGRNPECPVCGKTARASTGA